VIVRAPVPVMRVRGRAVHRFQAFGLAGLALGLGLAALGAALAGRGGVPVLWLGAEAVATFLVLALAAKAATGEERLVCAHHLVAVLAVGAATLRWAGEPVLAYLDLVAIGLFAFLAAGRVGCLAAGCCHGRPARHGVVYGCRHVDAGMAGSHARIPLVPVQALEAAGSLALAGAGLALVAGGAREGSALAVLVCGYGLLRFLLEDLRGDPRPAALGLSEAQWTAVAAAAGVALISATGAGRVAPAAVAMAAAILTLAAGRVVSHRGDRGERRRLRAPAHTAETISLLARGPADGDVAVASTSLGAVVSVAAGPGGRHCALSWPGHDLRAGDRRWFARLAAGAGGSPEAIAGRNGVVHVIARTADAPGRHRIGT
jgi:prolipoprotein diacylglyceryl transferase